MCPIGVPSLLVLKIKWHVYNQEVLLGKTEWVFDKEVKGLMHP